MRGSCKATGLDGLPAKFIIDSAESIVKPLTYIVNFCLEFVLNFFLIESGVFPDDLKRAKIVPTVVAKRIRTFCYFIKKRTNKSETAKQITNIS